MGSPVRVKITGFDAQLLIASAKKARVFERFSGGGVVEVKLKKVSPATFITELSKYPEASQHVKTGRKLEMTVPDEQVFFYLLLALTDAEMTQYQKFTELDYRNHKIGVLKELRRLSPYISQTFGMLNSEILRADESIEETIERITGKGHSDGVPVERSVEEILAEVYQRRAERSAPKGATGLLG